MSERDKKILYIETGILLITIPLALIGWHRFFKLANEFIDYEQRQQEYYKNNDSEKELLLKYAELKKELDTRDNMSSKYAEVINNVKSKKLLNENADDDEYLIVTLALTTCQHCKNFKPTAKEFASSINYKYYWINLDKLDTDVKKELTGLFDEYRGTPYTAVIHAGKIAGSISGNTTLEDLTSRMNEIIK